ncbi:hypothetical protein [Dyella sp. M7H15-1]|nr:hypothetical protein [Dyella sp. M7H15-1]
MTCIVVEAQTASPAPQKDNAISNAITVRRIGALHFFEVSSMDMESLH